MRRGRLSGQYGRLSSFTTCWWAGEECRAAVMYGDALAERREGSHFYPLLCPSPPPASLPPLAVSRTAARRGTVLSLRLLWSLFVSPDRFHTFSGFFSLVYGKYAGLSRFYLSLSPRIFFFRRNRGNLCLCISIYIHTAYLSESFMVEVCFLSLKTHFVGKSYPLNPCSSSFFFLLLYLSFGFVVPRPTNAHFVILKHE